MNATDKARRSDSLYFDSVTRRALCDLVANLEDTNEKLKALAFKLYECSQHGSCSLCRHLDSKCDFPRDMRALGMDVKVKSKGGDR